MFFKNKITYLGFNIDKDGLSKNKERVSCVLNAPNPRNISEVRAFTGMVNYYSKFIDRFSEKMDPIYQLLRKGVEFKWTNQC